MESPRQQKLSLGWERGKPWLQRYLPKLLILALLIGGSYWAWMQTTSLLPVKQLAVTGVMQQVSSTELREVVRPLVQEGFVRMDVLAVRDAVEAMPWVSRTTIRRQWPDTLAIEVEEQQLLAQWGSEALVNTQGELFRPRTVETESVIPRFDGIAGMNQRMATAYQRYQQMLSEVELTVLRVEVTERRAWLLELDNGIELVLGREPSERHLQRFIDVMRSGLSQRAEEISRVDLRYSNGFAVRWKDNKIG